MGLAYAIMGKKVGVEKTEFETRKGGEVEEANKKAGRPCCSKPSCRGLEALCFLGFKEGVRSEKKKMRGPVRKKKDVGSKKGRVIKFSIRG